MGVVVSRVFDPVIEIPLLIASVIFMALANGLRFRFLIFDVYQRGFAGVIYALGFGDEADFRLGYDPPGRTGGLYFFTILPSFCVVFAFLLGKVLLAKILFFLVLGGGFCADHGCLEDLDSRRGERGGAGVF